MKHKTLGAWLLGLCLISPHVWSAENFDFTTLQQLFNQYKRQQAYDYARQYLDDKEGDPYFDYYYGVSAIDSGHASQGVFALERVLLVFPEDHVARLELARGYFILEEYARSRQEFDRVLASKPPRGVVETAQRYLDMIRLREARYRTTSSGYLELGFGSDSNVNSGIDESNSLVQAQILSNDAVGQDDSFSSVTAAWQNTHPFAPGWMLNSAITGNLRKNQDFDQYDGATGTVQFGVSRISKQSRYKSELMLQQYNLDGDKYRSLSALNLEWLRSLGEQSKISTTLLYAALEYPDQSYRDSSLINLTLGYQTNFNVPMSPTFFSSLTLGTEQAKNDDQSGALENTERDIVGARLGLLLNFTPRLGLQTSASWQNSSYAQQQIVLTTVDTRDDDFISADINLLWLFSRNWRLDTRVAWSENTSNLDVYSYDRRLLSMHLNYSF